MKLWSTTTMSEARLSFSFSRRSALVGGLQLAVGGLLAGRMAWIAIAQNEKYQLLSESNRVNLTIVPPRRGWIIDRNGLPLAANRTDFRVDIIPDRLRDKDRVLALLTRLLNLQPNDLERIREELDKAAGFQPVQVADGLSYEQFATISVNLAELPGVAPAQGFSRHYPAGPSVGHLVGYVGAASAEDYQKKRDPLLITPGFKLGKQGLERSFDNLLTGKPGARRVEVTARGKVVRDLETRADTPGQSIRLTVDAGLQEFAGRRLGTQSGSVVVMDCETGDVLACASMPSFDPNSFSDGISHIEWEMLSKDDHVPLRNKSLQGLYPPGSTVKPMVALSFLGAGLRPDATVQCSGALRVGNTRFHCWSRRGHGTVNMQRAIAVSCDIYFYHFAQQIGMDAIASMARRLGMGQRFSLPYPSQSFGTVPDPAWKQKKFDQPWQAYDTVNATIGQGYMLVNPTQLAVMASRIASGRNVGPRFLADPRAPQAASLGLPQDHLDLIHAAMRDVVNGGGTGGLARMDIPGVLLAGKTGTAQVRRITMAERRSGVRSNASLPFKLRDHVLFIGYAPFDKPRYAVGCIIEHGGHIDSSQDAAPIASDCIAYLYDQAKMLDKLARLEQRWGGTPQARLARQLESYRIARGIAAPPATDAMNAAANAANAADSSTGATSAPQATDREDSAALEASENPALRDPPESAAATPPLPVDSVSPALNPANSAGAVSP
jgi:penicillin-binding protein 2